MRILFAALALSPWLAHAATPVPDPTDVAASVPALTVQSAFDGYQPWQEGQAPSWQQLNRAVTPGQNMTAMKHGREPGDVADQRRRHAHGSESK